MTVKTVTAAILERDGCVLLAQRSAADPLALMWEFPGGTVEQGETPEECLRREIEEELGIHVDIVAFFGESRYRDDRGEIRLRAYKVRWLSGRIRPFVHADVRWVPINELGRYDMAPADRPFVAQLLAEHGDA